MNGLMGQVMNNVASAAGFSIIGFQSKHLTELTGALRPDQHYF